MTHNPEKARSGFTKFLVENGLSLSLLGLFLVSLVGQIAVGFQANNETLIEHGGPPITLADYLQSGHFLEAVFENWESEFLQMALFVVLTIKLYQKGSSESKSLEEDEAVDEDPRQHRHEPNAPWPVKRGGLVLWLYERSLSIALFLLFIASFVGHAVAGLRNINEENLLHGKPREDFTEYVSSSQFWFESFQNWQSEFLAVLAIVTLSVYLRQRGSPQSKPVAASHEETGN